MSEPPVKHDPLHDLVHGVPPVSISHTSTLDNKTGSWKYIRPIYHDRVAPCNEGCPVGIDIEGYMNLIREGRTEDALELLLRENPMPATTGRVCYHPCENVCNRRYRDGSVSIHAIERVLGDMALDAPLPGPSLASRVEKVAVVGSGPAGLSCSYQLARLGCQVTIFESAPEPGGVLRFGIPEYRLPKNILSREIERITALGVELRSGVRVGKDVSWDALKSYDAIFIGIGVHQSLPLGIDGEGESEAILPGLGFLRDVNFGKPPSLGKRVVVVGGGNTAMDCARTALRLGADPMVLYRRTRAEMPATDEEIEEAEEEGIVIEFLAAPVAARVDNGKLLGLECIRMQLGGVDASGRRRPVPVEGSEFFVPADAVLSAIGEGPDFQGFDISVEKDAWVVKAGSLGETSQEGVFAAGDIIEDPHTVAHALGAGKRAAIGIDRYLRIKAGEDLPPEDFNALRYGRFGNPAMTRWRKDDPVRRENESNEVVPFEDLNMEHFEPTVAGVDRRLAASSRKSTFDEVNLGLDQNTALDEARRCFNCGVCNECELCLIYCPDLAITRRGNGGGFVINYEYCKGCGLCNAECPRGAMVMTREGL